MSSGGSYFFYWGGSGGSSSSSNDPYASLYNSGSSSSSGNVFSQWTAAGTEALRSASQAGADLLHGARAAGSDALQHTRELADGLLAGLGLRSEGGSGSGGLGGLGFVKGGQGRLQEQANRFLADWRWNSRALGLQVRVPLPTLVDERFALALFELCRTLLEQGGLHGSEALQPVTVCLMLGNALVFTHPGGVLLRNVCLSPYCVVERHQLGRLLSCALVHLDATHLLANAASALPHCISLEKSWGSAAFLLDLLALAGGAHGLFVGWAWLGKALLGRPGDYYSVGAVGMSSVVFALQVVSGREAQSRGASASLLGVPVAPQYVWVFNLALSSICVPDASFPSHVCGVVAGLLHAYVLRPALAALTRGQGEGPGALPGVGPYPRARVWGSGTTSGRPVRREGGWRLPAWAKELALQAGLLVVAGAVHVMARRHRAGQPINGWSFK